MKPVVVLALVVLLGVGGFIFVSQNNNDSITDDGNENLSIVASFYPLEYALETIVGDLGEVTNVGEGRDPHDFEPTTQDMLTMQRADLVVLQGAEFEPWGEEVKDRLEADGVPVVLATAGIELKEGGHHHDEHEDEHSDEHDEMHGDEHEEDGEEHEDGHEDGGEHDEEDGHDEEHEHDDDEEHSHEDEHDHDHGAFDPHTWLNPVLFQQTIENLTDEIVLLDPENADIYRSNATDLGQELTALDEEYTSRLQNCELDEVIASHDAFGYLADRYGFEIHSIGGLSTQDTPSATTLAELKEEAEEGVGAILLEENSVAAFGETLARETGLQTLSINPVAYVIPDGEDYLSIMRSNLDSLAEALRCNE